jgi:hypothetical protein
VFNSLCPSWSGKPSTTLSKDVYTPSQEWVSTCPSQDKNRPLLVLLKRLPTHNCLFHFVISHIFSIYHVLYTIHLSSSFLFWFFTLSLHPQPFPVILVALKMATYFPLFLHVQDTSFSCQCLAWAHPPLPTTSFSHSLSSPDRHPFPTNLSNSTWSNQFPYLQIIFLFEAHSSPTWWWRQNQLWNSCLLQWDYMVLYPRKLSSSMLHVVYYSLN